jgi:hypothetical protein
MHKYLIRFVALLLVPFLIADSFTAFASTLNSPLYSGERGQADLEVKGDADTQNIFILEAFGFADVFTRQGNTNEKVAQEIDREAAALTPAAAPEKSVRSADMMEFDAITVQQMIQDANQRIRSELGLNVEIIIQGSVQILKRLPPWTRDLDLLLIYDASEFEGFDQALKESLHNELIKSLSQSVQNREGWQVRAEAGEHFLVRQYANGNICKMKLEIYFCPESQVDSWRIFEPARRLERFLSSPADLFVQVHGVLAAVRYFLTDRAQQERIVKDYLGTHEQNHPDWAAFLMRWSNLMTILHTYVNETPSDKIKARLIEALRTPIAPAEPVAAPSSLSRAA